MAQSNQSNQSNKPQEQWARSTNGFMLIFDNKFKHVTKAYPDLLTVSGVAYSLLSLNPLGLYFSIATMLNEMLNHGIKTVLKQFAGDHPEWWRPDGRPLEGCGSLSNCGKLSELKQQLVSATSGNGKSPDLKSLLALLPNNDVKSIGMPSGHAQTSVAAAIFWSMMIMLKGKSEWNYLVLMIIWFITIIVCHSRVYIKCHTKEQVIYGMIIGIIIGLIMFRVVRSVMRRMSSTQSYNEDYPSIPSWLGYIVIGGFACMSIFLVSMTA
jgi:membrane-associated phospholipid phosphatase